MLNRPQVELPSRRLATITLLIASVAVLGGCGGAGTRTQIGSACHPRVHDGALPVWARTGFHPPTQPMRYAVGTAGDIAAVLFGYPLRSPPLEHRNNKILWVSRLTVNGETDLSIAAQRMKGGAPVGSPVQRTVTGGPGPSIINLPSPGCWRLALRWSGHVDHLDLRYS